MLRSLAALALLAGALTSCGGEDSSAACVAVLEVDGSSYYPRDRFEGEVPTTGEEVDAVIPGCNDVGTEPDEDVRVEVIRDVVPGTAVLHDGELYVRGGVQLPPSAGDWYPSVSCSAPGELALRGDLGGTSVPYQPYSEPESEAPYEVDLLVSEGSYADTWLEVQVTARTQSELTGADRRAPRRADVRATGRCDDGEFVAESIGLTSRHSPRAGTVSAPPDRRP